MRHSLRGKNIIRNQILVSKLWYISQIYTFSIYPKGNWEKNIKTTLEQEKIQPPRHWAQLFISRGKLGILLFLTDIQLRYVKMKWTESLLNPANAPWKDLMLYWPKLMLNPDQNLALFWEKQVLTRLLVTKIYKNKTINIFLFNFSILGYI